MRRIDKIIIHCTENYQDSKITVADIDRYHRSPKKGFKKIGYHYVIYQDGSVHTGRSESEEGAHTRGENKHSIGIAYVGGLLRGSTTKRKLYGDTRTDAQKASLKNLVQTLINKYPHATVHGHREFDPHKLCPCFDVRKTDLVEIRPQNKTSVTSTTTTFIDQAAEIVSHLESKTDEHIGYLNDQLESIKKLEAVLPSQEGGTVAEPNIVFEEDYSCEDEVPMKSSGPNNTISKIQSSMTHSIAWVNEQIMKIKEKIMKYIKIVTDWIQKQLKTVENWIKKQIKKAEDYLAKKLSEKNSILGSIKNGIAVLEGYVAKVMDMITKANQIIADSLSIISNAERLAQNATTITEVSGTLTDFAMSEAGELKGELSSSASMIPTTGDLTSSINTPTIPVTINNPTPPSIP